MALGGPAFQVSAQRFYLVILLELASLSIRIGPEGIGRQRRYQLGISMKHNIHVHALILATLASTALLAQAQYTAYDLGPGFACGINNAGTIVGERDGRAFSYSCGLMTDLGGIGGSESCARSVNDAGVIVGNNSLGHAFSYSGGVMTDLGTLGGSWSVAYGINGAGSIVGTSLTSGGGRRAFSFSNGHMTDLGTMSGDDSFGFAINSWGTIVGASSVGDGQSHAFSFSNGQMTDLGTLGGPYSTAMGINDAGTIVGANSGDVPLSRL